MSRYPYPPSSRYVVLAARIAVVLMIAVMLAGCGKKGNPVPPADQPSTFPTTYPKQ
jgi:predicted small lipoprotein YifL